MYINFYSKIIPICIIILSYNYSFAEEKDPPTQQQSFYFISLKGGEAFPAPIYGNTGLDTGKNTSVFGVLFGKKLNDIVALDVEYNHRDKNTIQNLVPNETTPTTWSMKSDMISLNITLNLMLDSKITPYIRGGVGKANNTSGQYTSYDEDTSSISNFPGKKITQTAWQLGGGFNFAFSSNYSTQFEYMYVDRGSVETQSYFYDESGDKVNFLAKNGDFRDHQLTFGITYKF